jgi:hypothetical protein
MGDSAYLRPGTPIHRVQGYTPTFHVAARYKGELTLYEADTNPDATTGADLLDIRGNVHYVGINSVKDGTTEIASIKQRTNVSRLVQLVLHSPVDQGQGTHSDEDYEEVPKLPSRHFLNRAGGREAFRGFATASQASFLCITD